LATSRRESNVIVSLPIQLLVSSKLALFIIVKEDCYFDSRGNLIESP